MNSQMSTTTNVSASMRGREMPKKGGFDGLKAALFQGSTLRRQLLTVVLPTTLLPLMVAGGLGFNIIQGQAKEDALEVLEQEAARTSNAARILIQDTLIIPKVVALDTGVGEAIRRADERAAAEGLGEKSVDQLEAEFSQFKLLNPNSLLNSYLENVAIAEDLGEIFVTDRRGLNVGYSRQTSDFVQRDEAWWQGTKATGTYVDVPEIDESVGAFSVGLSTAIITPSTGEFQGVIKSVLPTSVIERKVVGYTAATLSGSQRLQLMDAQAGVVFTTVSGTEVITSDTQSLDGGDALRQAANVLASLAAQEGNDVADDLDSALRQIDGVKVFSTNVLGGLDGRDRAISALIEYGDRDYGIVSIPGTPWVAIASESIADLNAAGIDLLTVFGGTAAILGLAAIGLLILLGQELSSPLDALTKIVERATAGNLDVRSTPAGTVEMRTLGQGFNQLLERLQLLLDKQRTLAADQQQQREDLETEIARLMEDVGDAAEGDLTVRAQLSAGDVGIVADLFNAIIENLRATAVRVKDTTEQVNTALANNEIDIRQFSEQAATEVQSLQDTMDAVNTISQSIQLVAERANQAALLTQDTYTTVQTSSHSMDETVDSILGLRSTVGETAKKIKRLGESAQKISQAVSLIDEIALKTNLLAVNASVEATRAGELGQGFTAVAEQVGSLAEQSAQATKDIAQIVAAIQTETQEVVTAIEVGTAQVVDSSKLVESTKYQLNQALAKSEEINELMDSISRSTVQQTESATAVTTLMQQATHSSKVRSKKSTAIAQAIRETAKTSSELRASVEQFKVVDESGTMIDTTPVNNASERVSSV